MSTKRLRFAPAVSSFTETLESRVLLSGIGPDSAFRQSVQRSPPG